MSNKIKSLICGLLILASLLLCACPAPYDKSMLVPDKFYNASIEYYLYQLYGVEFNASIQKDVSISYNNNGLNYKATFNLNGYDDEKLIGYKVILMEDKEKWDQSLKNGETDAPNTNYLDIIQKSALQYDFPIILIAAYQYPENINKDNASDIEEKYVKDLNNILESDEIKEWAKAGLYNGDWIKERIEEDYYNSPLKLNFSHDSVPTVTVTYLKNGKRKKAEFLLDGYDPEQQIGYKFVTVEDEKVWSKNRDAGDKTAPDLNDYTEIKEAALEYDFPVMFFYVHDYWKYTINRIIELADNDSMNYLTEWIDSRN